MKQFVQETQKKWMWRSLAALALTLAFGVSSASALVLPRPSPAAKVEQTVGVTKITVSYFSPGVKGRKIFGALVPYGKLWRTGANGSTKISFSHDVKIGGKAVKAGTYSIFTIPGQKSWKLFLNSKLKIWGTRGYDKKNNVLELDIKPAVLPKRERLTFIFNNSTDNGTTLHLEWDTVGLPIAIAVDTKKYASANIKKALANPWRPSFSAARYMLSAGDIAQADKFINESIKLQSNWWNNWVKAEILAKQGKTADALKHAQLSAKLGKGQRIYEGFYKNRIAAAIAKWGAKKAPAKRR